MGFLPNVFSDPVLRTRQEQLDAQWKALWSIYQGCQNTPGSTFSEFVNDKRNWDSFFESGSDWSDNSKHATDLWTVKAQDWSNRLKSFGCYGSIGSEDLTASNNSIPSVKDPPPDEPGFLDTIQDKVDDAQNDFFGTLKTIGWVSVGLVVLLIGSLVYVLTRGKAEGYGVKVGG